LPAIHLPEKQGIKQDGAEFLGTFWLVMGGCGSAVLAATFPEVGIGLHGVALAFGLPYSRWPTPSDPSPAAA
jgi:glycerol uptake facilitator-like aquaporin